MDVEWALEQLREYRDLAVSYRGAESNASRRERFASELDKRFTTVQQVIDRVRPGTGKNALAQPLPSGRRDVRAILLVCDIAIGEYERREERNVKLGSSAPRMSADTLHPWVWQSAESLWHTGHRREAVQAAATLINAKAQQKLHRRDISDSDLMRQAFSVNEPQIGRPRLRWPGDSSDVRVSSMNNGLRDFSAGVFQTIRNAATHDPSDIPEQEALEQLSALSLLARWIEQCDLVTAESDDTA